MVNSRTNRNKRARTNVSERGDVDDDVDNAMAFITKALLAKSLEIKRLEARLEQMSSESSAAMSRFQQLSDDNAALEKENKDQAETIENYRLQLSKIRKEMRKSISEEKCRKILFLNADKLRSLSVDEAPSITRAGEPYRRVAEGWDNMAEIRDLAEVNMKKFTEEQGFCSHTVFTLHRPVTYFKMIDERTFLIVLDGAPTVGPTAERIEILSGYEPCDRKRALY
ncbi:hypothetical protein EAE99_007091 [Botrytis elliptica]|nr:hypothetical protein EAE99_007091 [Botrytis elliptica]